MPNRLDRQPFLTELVIESIDLDPQRTHRLRELGLGVGTTVQLLRRTAGDGYIVGIGVMRVALDRASLEAIQAQPLATVAPKSQTGGS